MKTHSFPIGTTFLSRGKVQREKKVVDHLTVTNSKGEVVEIRYVVEHEFLGQKIIERDVVETTIKMGKL